MSWLFTKRPKTIFFEEIEIIGNSEALLTKVYEKQIISLKFPLKVFKYLIKYIDVLQIKSKPQ
jgi:hypothetical protein